MTPQSALKDQLAAARAEVERLERIAATATCREIGCDMQFIGGRNAGCDVDDPGMCGCSVPVHRCSRCGDCDYGDTPEAAEIRRACKYENAP